MPEFLERAGLLLRQLAHAAGELGAQDPRDDRRARGADASSRCPIACRWRTSSAARGRSAPRAHRATTTARSSSATGPSSTTSSSSTSATSPTWTSSGSARRRSPGSPTWASRRWCRASRSICSAPTTSSSSSRRLAVELDVAGRAVAGTVDEALAAVAAAPAGPSGSPPGRRRKDPWFNFSSGSGMYSDDKVWLDHPEIPLGFDPRLRRAACRQGQDIDRPTEQIAAERERITSRVPRAAARRRGARRVRREARAVAGWCSRTSRTTTSTSSTGRCRCSGARSGELGQVLADAGFWAEADDIFYLRRDEIPLAIFDYGNAWAVGAEPTGPVPLAADHRPAQGDRRRAVGEGAAAGDERAAGGHHRAVHDHALRHHHRARERVAVGRRRTAAS